MSHSWQSPPELNIPSDLLRFCDNNHLLAQLLVQRGLTTPEQARPFLNPDDYRPVPPEALPDLKPAIIRLAQAVERRELICVWGDFDVDGQTATSLLVSTLRDLGGEVRYYIPDRLTESHGLKLPALHRLLAEGVKLILTCDTGITGHDAIAAAAAAGVEVIVTDHHDLAESLPPALAAINPKRLPPGHPLRDLPGVGVAYKVAEALYQAYNRPTDGEQLLDLVALGIVADVAYQSGDTRYLLQKGLTVLNQTGRTGLQALFESARLKTNRLTEDHIAFWLAPRLNALGRLGDANLAVELLTTTDLSRARIITLQLEALNDRRKLLVDRVVIQALSQLEDNPALAEYNAIVLAANDWHPGVIGLAAARLVEQYHKPVVLIALRPEGQGRGSARSVAGCDIHQALKTQAELLTNFGGHPMAAGLALPAENLTAFRRGLSAALNDCQPQLEQALTIDLLVELPQISAELLAAVRRLAPFGPGNPPVRFGCSGLQIAGQVKFGQFGTHQRLVVEDEQGRRQEVIRWGGAAERLPQGRFDLAFSLSSDDFKGSATQVEWLAAHEWEPALAVHPIEFIDWRAHPNPHSLLSNFAQSTTSDQSPITNHQLPITNYQLPITNSLLLWSEALPLPLPALPRHQLHPAETLVIWTAPPGQDILQQAIAAVRPERVIMVGQLSPFDTLPAFIKQLMGLIKYAIINKEGEVYFEELAAALGHRLATARLGIDWLVAQGKLSIYVEEEALLVLRPDQRPANLETAATLETILNSTLAETAAYRRFFREASLESLRKAL